MKILHVGWKYCHQKVKNTNYEEKFSDSRGFIAVNPKKCVPKIRCEIDFRLSLRKSGKNRQISGSGLVPAHSRPLRGRGSAGDQRRLVRGTQRRPRHRSNCRLQTAEAGRIPSPWRAAPCAISPDALVSGVRRRSDAAALEMIVDLPAKAPHQEIRKITVRSTAARQTAPDSASLNSCKTIHPGSLPARHSAFAVTAEQSDTRLLIAPAALRHGPSTTQKDRYEISYQPFCCMTRFAAIPGANSARSRNFYAESLFTLILKAVSASIA